MTKTTRVRIAAKKAKTDMRMVENRDAAPRPMTPKMKAKSATNPAIGWRIKM